MGFSGFPAETISFLRNLKVNNSTPWFQGHKADYEAFVLKPASDFIQAVGPKLKAASKKGKTVPVINGSLFRMEQGPADSAAPYKATLDLWFWEGEEKNLSLPGYYLRLTPDRFVVGAGLHRFSPVLAECYRAAVQDVKAGATLVKIISALEELAFVPPTGKALPAGIAPSHKRADLLRHQGLHAEIDIAHPKALHSARIADQVLEKWLDGQPLCRWIMTNVVAPSRKATN